MSGAIGITAVVSVGACLAVWLLSVKLSRRAHAPRLYLLATAVAVVLLPVVCVATWHLLFWITTSEEHGVSPERANRAFAPIAIPASAADVNYRSSVFEALTYRADFAIDEQNFLDWAESQGWRVSALQCSESGSPRYADSPANSTGLTLPAGICNGYSIRIPGKAPDAGTTIVYDADSGRALVEHFTF